RRRPARQSGCRGNGIHRLFASTSARYSAAHRRSGAVHHISTGSWPLHGRCTIGGLGGSSHRRRGCRGKRGCSRSTVRLSVRSRSMGTYRGIVRTEGVDVVLDAGGVKVKLEGGREQFAALNGVFTTIVGEQDGNVIRNAAPAAQPEAAVV